MSDKRPSVQGVLVSPVPEWLSIADLIKYLGVSRSSVTRLMRHIPYTKAPGIGIRFRRVDVDAYLQDHLIVPAARTPTPLPRRSGMPVAADDDDSFEVLPGVTRGELKKAAGF